MWRDHVGGGIVFAASSGSSRRRRGRGRRLLPGAGARPGGHGGPERELARKQIRNVTASTEGIVDCTGPTTRPRRRGGAVLAGRPRRHRRAGRLPFFRSLAPGDQAGDVLELQILAAAGGGPGTMDSCFSQQRSSPWPSDRPSTTIRTPRRPTRSVTVSLRQGTGYRSGRRTRRADHRARGGPGHRVRGCGRCGAATSTHTDQVPAGAPGSRSSWWTTRCPRASRHPW